MALLTELELITPVVVETGDVTPVGTPIDRVVDELEDELDVCEGSEDDDAWLAIVEDVDGLET